MVERGFRLGPQAYLEKLKTRPIIVGFERCASSLLSESGALIVCSMHGHGLAKTVLHRAVSHLDCCRECIEEECELTGADTLEAGQGLHENLIE